MQGVPQLVLPRFLQIFFILVDNKGAQPFTTPAQGPVEIGPVSLTHTTMIHCRLGYCSAPTCKRPVFL
jgi:hypothetical protein